MNKAVLGRSKIGIFAIGCKEINENLSQSAMLSMGTISRLTGDYLRHFGERDDRGHLV